MPYLLDSSKHVMASVKTFLEIKKSKIINL
jgi:hypothetical protein